MNGNKNGFTLIELMIVIAIIGILAAVALPAYQDYTIRSKISEMVMAGGAVRSLMSEAYQAGGVGSMTSSAIVYNAAPIAEKRSKYVNNVTIVAGTPWTITVFLNATAASGIPTGMHLARLTLSPNVLYVTPTSTSTGAIDWACASATSVTATTRGFGNIALGSIPAAYVPIECR